jgi:flagellar biosynthetic protein FlhB
VQDALVAAIIFVSAYALSWTGQLVYQWLLKFVTETLQTIPEYKTLTYTQALQLLLRVAIIVFVTTAPFILAIVITVLVVLYAQVGWLITFKPLEPKFDKLDPVKGFKNKINPFKMKQAFNLLKTFALMGLIGFLVYTTLRDHMGIILQSITLSPAGALSLIGYLMIELAKKIAEVMLVIAFISYMFERWNWWKGLKMSDKEIRDEYKQQEGDPHIKGKQKQKMMQMAMGAAREAVPNADVIITNPTHYAVALEYKPTRGMKSPVVIAKGKNNMALFIRELGEENFIPVVEDPVTARALYAQVKIGQTIPAELFVAVAKIIASLMKKRGRQPMYTTPPPSLTGYAPIVIEPGPHTPTYSEKLANEPPVPEIEDDEPDEEEEP